MRILLLNQTYHPDVAATAQHAHDLALYLIEAGHEVIVVTSRSIYGSKGAALPRYEVNDGVEVHRVGASLFGKGGIPGRAADYGVFYLLAAWKVLLMNRVDVVVPFTTPPLIAGVGLLRKLLRGTPYVYWVMDLYPDVAVACGVIKSNGLLQRTLEWISRCCMRSASKVVILGRCMRDRLRSKRVSDDKLALIGVWADADEVRPVPREDNPLRTEWGLSGKFVVMYSGNIGVAHDVATMCGAMLQLRDHEHVRFVFVGGGRRLEEIKAFKEQHGLANVQFRPYQPRSAIPHSLSVGDVHLISQRPALTGMLVPCKLFGVMAAGRPVLYIGASEAEVGRIVEEVGCGTTISPGDENTLTQAINYLARNPDAGAAQGRLGREAMEHRFDRRFACAAWERLLVEVSNTCESD